MNIIEKYLQHLAENPERIDSHLQLAFCTLVVWFVIWIFRERFLNGLAGDGRHPGEVGADNLDAREQLIFIYYFIPVPAVFYGLFFKDLQTYQFAVICITVAPGFYQIFGRFIFDWILAVKSGLSKVPDEQKKETTTTTTTETKTS